MRDAAHVKRGDEKEVHGLKKESVVLLGGLLDKCGDWKGLEAIHSPLS